MTPADAALSLALSCERAVSLASTRTDHVHWSAIALEARRLATQLALEPASEPRTPSPAAVHLS